MSEENLNNLLTEPLFKEDPSRFVLFPIKHSDIWEAYENHKNAFWTAQEIDYAADLEDWNKLNANEKYFIEHILAFFAGSDGIVLENLLQNFCNEIQIPEVRCFYTFQAMMENIHSEVYSLLIDTFIKEPSRKTMLFNAIDTIPCVEQKAKWALKWIDSSRPYSERLVAFAVVEGIFFSGSFCAIFWLKNRGKMVKALGTSNELISRDESLHTQFAILLYSKIVNKLSDQQVKNIITEAVEIEKTFICESLPCNLIGMNKDLMGEYIEFVADRLITQLGYSKIYNTKNPFSFMDIMNLDGKSNFFEKRVTEYSIASSSKNTHDDSTWDNLYSSDF
jgi:ribonucleotide reductase beta subunit family protein with ferritin-like domain